MATKTILITGATSGFGRAAAELLAKDGHRLILVGRRADRLAELQRSLQTPVHTATVDVTDAQQVAQCLASLPADFNTIDVLVNSAGLALGMEPVPDTKLADWQQMVDTNIQGLLNVTHAVLPGMTKRGQGLVINIGSMAAEVPYKGGNVYGATKAFVRHFSRNLRTDLFGSGVKVTNLEPGAAETEFSVVRFKDKQKADDYYKGWRPLQPTDIAGAIQWVVNQPDHVNIDNIEMMPLDQTYAGMALHKKDS